MSPNHTGKNKNSGKTKNENSEDSRQRIPFHFHAEAHGFSGTFVRPVLYPIEAQASVSLPTVGGSAQSRVENFSAGHLVRFAAAQCHVAGSWQEDNRVVHTRSTATIEGLNILDFITADRIVAQLTSEHHVGELEGHIIALGSTFEGLKIGGHDVKVTLHHRLLFDHKTFAALKNEIEKDEKLGKLSATTEQVALCSLAKDIEVEFPGLKKEGHILRIDHFGEIAIAEVFSAFGTKTLTMLRLKLGSPQSGTGTVTEATTNGQPAPPTPGGGSGGSS